MPTPILIDDAMLRMKYLRTVPVPAGCFMAGTLVHTKEGLVPIENIKVGNWVLSQPEETGERAYKRVVNTVKVEDKEIWSVEVYPKSALDKAREEGTLVEINSHSRLVVTGNHPFWVIGKGWTQVDILDSCRGLDGSRVELELADGQSAYLLWAAPVIRTVSKSKGWIQGSALSEYGTFIDLSKGADSVEFDFKLRPMSNHGDINKGIDWWNRANAMRCTVFNLEVENFHTYYGGTAGIWVHHTRPKLKDDKHA